MGTPVDIKQAPLPTHRASRLMHLGRLAGGLAGGMVAEGMRRLASGQLPSPSDLLLTPANAARVADRLSELRGAAMKVGQLLSMEAGEFLPEELTNVLCRLREDAHAMPLSQVAALLHQAWGETWPKRFKRFVFRPMAAASIGQVHEAVTREGRHLAIKIQYPGVARSIDGDVDNVAGLFTLFQALPDKRDVAPLLEEAKRQLHAEADYIQEAANIVEYRRRLDGDPEFIMPEVVHELTTREALAMSYVPGRPIEHLENEPRSVRDRVATLLIRLSLREFFDWGLVQTDANLGNYRYDPDSGRIGLLDFGATRGYAPDRIEMLRRLFIAAVDQDHGALEHTATEVGYLEAVDPPNYRRAIRSLLVHATEPSRHSGLYDFGTSGLASRMSKTVMDMRFEQRMWRLPPADILFLHRKLGGLYLLCARLRARVDVGALAAPYLTR